MPRIPLRHLYEPFNLWVFLLSGTGSVILAIVGLLRGVPVDAALLFVASWVTLVIAFQPWRRPPAGLQVESVFEHGSVGGHIRKYLVRIKNVSDEKTVRGCAVKLLIPRTPELLLPSVRGGSTRIDLDPGDGCEFHLVEIASRQVIVGVPSMGVILPFEEFVINLVVTGDDFTPIRQDVRIEPGKEPLVKLVPKTEGPA